MANSAFLNLNNLVVDNIKSFTMIDSSTNEDILNISTIPTDEYIETVEERVDALDSFGNVIFSFYKTNNSNNKNNNQNQIRPKARICTQCGAVLHGNKCEYCGTEYR